MLARGTALGFVLALMLAACVGDGGPTVPQDSGADAKPQGSEGGACFPNGTCNAGLTCTLVNGTGQCTMAADAAASDVSTDAPTDTNVGDGGDGGCTPKNCTDLGYDCGQQLDNCGKPIDCGGCTAPKSCNSAGKCI